MKLSNGKVEPVGRFTERRSVTTLSVGGEQKTRCEPPLPTPAFLPESNYWQECLLIAFKRTPKWSVRALNQ